MTTTPDVDQTVVPAAPAGTRLPRMLLLAVFGLIFGLLAARFLFAGDGVGDLPPVTAVGLTADERIAALTDDIDRDPNNLPALQELASLAIGQAAVTGDPSYYARATQALDQAEALDPENVPNKIVRGNLDLALHEFSDAGRVAREILDDQPGNIGGLLIQVDAQVELGRYDAAGETLQDLLDRRPSLPALARTSYFRELNGDLDGAVTAMQQAVTAGSGLRNELATVQALLGDLQLRRGDKAAATTAYNEALSIIEAFSPARVGLARLKASNGDVEGAIADLVDVTNRAPYPGGLTLLAELQEFSGDAAAAADTAEVLRAVTTLQAESGQVVDLELADFELTVGSTQRGYQLAQDTYEARPTIYGSSVLAWALYEVDEPGMAEKFARQSLELGSLDPVLNYRAAQILADLGDTELATTAIERALGHDPSGTFRYRDDVIDLAGDLEVDLPATWAAAATS